MVLPQETVQSVHLAVCCEFEPASRTELRDISCHSEVSRRRHGECFGMHLKQRMHAARTQRMHAAGVLGGAVKDQRQRLSEMLLPNGCGVMARCCTRLTLVG